MLVRSLTQGWLLAHFHQAEACGFHWYVGTFPVPQGWAGSGVCPASSPCPLQQLCATGLHAGVSLAGFLLACLRGWVGNLTVSLSKLKYDLSLAAVQ